MSTKDQIKQIVDYFKREPQLKDKTDGMAEGLLLGANLADEANERSKDAKETTLAVQEKYKDQILAQDLNPNKDPELVDLRNGNATAGERITKFEQETTTQITEMDNNLELKTQDLIDRGVNLRFLGAALDGVTDDYQLVMDALETYKYVIVPPGVTLATSDTIKVKTGQALIGASPNRRGYGKTSKIKYIGEKNTRKAVVIIGSNDVGAEPTTSASDVMFKNFIIECDNKAGFGVYGTYLTDETHVDNIYVTYALEYAGYFARGWYASLTNLAARGGRGQGFAFGMPLEFLDGEKVNWTTANPLELNMVLIRHIRVSRFGSYFSEEFPNTFKPTNPDLRRKGYGIGFGIGNGFVAETFISEQNGGVGIYDFTDSQPVKAIRDGYLEGNCLNSGLDPSSNMAQMIIENISPLGGSHTIENVLMNYQYGGIYHTGVLGRKVKLKNIHQPRFLKSLDGLTDIQLYAEVLKENVYYLCGYFNTDPASLTVDLNQTVKTRSYYKLDLVNTGNQKLLYMKSPNGGNGSYRITNEDGTSTTFSYPTNSKLTYVRTLAATVVSISQNSSEGAVDQDVQIVVLNTPLTTY